MPPARAGGTESSNGATPLPSPRAVPTSPSRSRGDSLRSPAEAHHRGEFARADDDREGAGVLTDRLVVAAWVEVAVGVGG